LFESTTKSQTSPSDTQPAQGNPHHPAAAQWLEVAITPSRYLRTFYLLIYAALIGLTLGLALLGGTFARLSVGVSALLLLQGIARLRWLAAQHWRLLCSADGWWLGRTGAQLQPMQLSGDTRLWRNVTFFTLTDGRSKHPLLLLRDSAAADDLRRLRVLLLTR